MQLLRAAAAAREAGGIEAFGAEVEELKQRAAVAAQQAEAAGTKAREVAERAQREAEAFGDVALQVEDYEGQRNAACRGIFVLQPASAEGRPMYKKAGVNHFLFYSALGNWMVGPKVGQGGWWKVQSEVTTPGRITQTWAVHDGSDWVEVRAAQIVKRAVFEKTAAREEQERMAEIKRSEARERQAQAEDRQRRAAKEREARMLAKWSADNHIALMAPGYPRERAFSRKFLGVFELQEEKVQERPTYKMPGKELFLYYTSTARTSDDEIMEQMEADLAEYNRDMADLPDKGDDNYNEQIVCEYLRLAAQTELDIQQWRETIEDGNEWKGCWILGPDTSRCSKAGKGRKALDESDPGVWRVKSAAMTPEAITETWQSAEETDDGNRRLCLAEAPTAKIVKLWDPEFGAWLMEEQNGTDEDKMIYGNDEIMEYDRREGDDDPLLFTVASLFTFSLCERLEYLPSVATHAGAHMIWHDMAREVRQATLRRQTGAEADWNADRAGYRVAAVAARRAVAPYCVRQVLDGRVLKDTAGLEMALVVMWLVGAHAVAHADPATKRLARLVLGIPEFAKQMEDKGVWDGEVQGVVIDEKWCTYKVGLKAALKVLGQPLAVLYAAEGLRKKLGNYQMRLHPLVKEDKERRPHLQQECNVEAIYKGSGGHENGRIVQVNRDGTFDVAFESGARDRAVPKAHIKYDLRSDIGGAVPLPGDWNMGADADPSDRQKHERIFIHMLVMIAMALNGRFHEMMVEVLRAHVVDGVGVMEKKNGRIKLCPEKGVARMECKRLTDHRHVPGCRPAMNIDVLRILGVCRNWRNLCNAMAALDTRFGGCGRVKNGFETSDKKAADNFDLRVMMWNGVVEFGLTFGQLASEQATKAMWQKHVELSAPEGGAPRDRWRAEAAAALAVLKSGELRSKQVVFICEAQMVLQETFGVRADMHELYKGYRADTCALLHADMLGDTRKANAEKQFMADGDTPLKKACRDGDAAAVRRLVRSAAAADRGASLAVACTALRVGERLSLSNDQRRGLVQVLPSLYEGLRGDVAARAWKEGWERAVSTEAACETDASVVDALLALVPGLPEGGVNFKWGMDSGIVSVAAEGRRGCSGLLRKRGIDVWVRVQVRAHQDGFLSARTDGLLESNANAKTFGQFEGGGYIGVEHPGTQEVVRLHPSNVTFDLRTALHRAAAGGHTLAVKRLLAAGASIDQTGGLGSTADIRTEGGTALRMAAEHGNEEVVAALLAAGAAVNGVKVNGWQGQSRKVDGATTPLIVAAAGGHDAVARQLLAAGAERSRRDRYGQTPGDAALRNDHDVVVAFLPPSEEPPAFLQ